MIREKSPFAVSDNELASVLSKAGSFVAYEFSTPTERPILPRVTQEDFDRIIGSALPRDGLPLEAISKQAQDFLSHYTARLMPAGFSAMVTTSPNPYALLADILACAVNQHIMRGDVCEFGVRLEERVIKWIGEFIGYPASSGSLTMGGSTANLIGLMAARTAILGREVRRKGLNGAPLVVYASSETHVCTVRAVDVLGIGTDNMKKIPVDANFRMDVNALANAIRADRAAGRVPLAVIAQGGSVATGAVDPLNEIASVCERETLWLHVDAAYGGPGAAVEPQTFAGLAKADSVTVDPHKWLYVNFDCGCVMTKHVGALETTFGADGASYLKADAPTDAPDFMNRSVDFSRGFRALKVWATFAGLGADKLRLAINQDIKLTEKLAELVLRHEKFELRAPASLSIAVFRFVPENNLSKDYLNALNSRIPTALREDGRIYFGSTHLVGEVVLRVCLINHRVTDTDLEEWLNIACEVGNALHRNRSSWWKEPGNVARASA